MSRDVSAPVRVMAGLVLVLGALAGCGDDNEAPEGGDEAGATTEGEEEQVEAQAFVTRPDLTPPVIDVTVDESETPGLLFLAPKQAGAQTGPLIIDDGGQVVWAHPTEGNAADFRVQSYRGEPVLTWWEGESLGGYGDGEFVVMDSSYQEVARVRPGDDRPGDLHEFQLTDEGTALVLSYVREPADLSPVDGPADGYTLESYVQEVDVATGEVLLEWRAGDHVAITDTYGEMVPDAAATDNEIDDDGSAEAPFDWFHVNSVTTDGDDTLLVSARNTHAVYAIDRHTGELRWTLGGRSSDFTMGEGAAFAWQHDARRLPDGTISIYDNQANPPLADESRALVLALDEPRGVSPGDATVVRELTHPDGVLAGSQGNAQLLEGGGMLVGWGSPGRLTEFDAEGQVVFDASWGPADSYRAYRLGWVGTPTTTPDVVARPARGGDDDGGGGGGEDDDAGGGGDGRAVEVAVSWNGATEVAQWRVLGGSGPDDLAPMATVPREGFETTVTVDAADHVAVEALDASGAVLATSEPVPVG